MTSLVLLGVSLLALLVCLYLVRRDYIIARGLIEDNCDNFFYGQKSGTFVEGLSSDYVDIDFINAKTVKLMTEDIATEEEIFKLLKPVLELVRKEACKGNFSAYVHGMDWYYGTNIKYSKAISRLKDMGYRVEYRPAMTGMTVSWN